MPSIGPVLRLLQVAGFLPSNIENISIQHVGDFSCQKTRFNTSNIVFTTLAIVFGLINVGLLAFNINLMVVFEARYGTLSAYTISSIITGLKPFHIILNFICFYTMVKRHKILLKSIHKIDWVFQQHGHKSQNLRSANFWLFSITIMCFALVLVTRIAQYCYQKSVPGYWLVDSSLVLVPMMTVWQLLPLFYIDYLTRRLSHYYKLLHNQMINQCQGNPQLEKFYSQYLMLAHATELLGKTINPFIFCSLLVSMCIVCLTIYFVTQARQIIVVPADYLIDPQNKETDIYFFIYWSFIQILTSCYYMIQICVTGTRTNESCRTMLPALMKILPENERERFVANYFVQKIQGQYAWGLSVWGVFPIERPLLFTLMSIMATYAVVLLKMKQDNAISCQTHDVSARIDHLTTYLTSLNLSRVS